jgi:hypothetical protein
MLHSINIVMLALALSACIRISPPGQAKEDRAAAAKSSCQTELTPRFLKKAAELGYDCTLNEIHSATLFNSQQNTFFVDYGEFDGLRVTVPAEGTNFPLRIDVEIVKDKDGIPWGLTIAGDSSVAEQATIELPKSVHALFNPAGMLDSKTLAITDQSGLNVRMSDKTIIVPTAESASFSVSTALWGYLNVTERLFSQTPPTLYPATPESFKEDEEATVTLTYSDLEGDLAKSCQFKAGSKTTITKPCACDAEGVCTIGLKGVDNFFGEDIFWGSVSAGGNTSSPSTITVTIDAVDDPSIATNVDLSTYGEGTTVTAVLAYTDIESDQAETCALSSLEHATAVSCVCIDGTCTAQLTAGADYSGSASAKFTVSSRGNASNEANISFNIDDAPTVQAFSASSTVEDTAITVTFAYADKNEHKATSCALLNLSNVTETTACSCTTEGVCTATLTPTLNFFGQATANFTVTANGLTSLPAIVTIPVTAVNDAPTITTNTFTFNEDTSSSVSFTYTDPEGDLANSCSITPSSNITVGTACACNGSGVCSATLSGSPQHFNGSTTIAVTVTSGATTSDNKTVNISVQPIDDAPTVSGTTNINLAEDTESSALAIAYTDVDNDLASSCTVSSLTNLTESTACACVSGTCTVKVTGTSNYFGSASFNFSVIANGVSSTGTAGYNVTIGAVDDAPVGANFTASSTAEESESADITLSYTDVENHSATTCTVTNLSNVSETTACSCSAGVCTVKVTGIQDFYGNATFSYAVTANGLASAIKTVTVPISNVEDAPVADAFSNSSINEDAGNTDVTISYHDVDGDTASSCQAIANDSNVTVNSCTCTSGTCKANIATASNFNGTTTFDFRVTANSALSNFATATLNIAAVDDAPVATTPDPVPSISEDTSSTITLSYTDVENHQAATCTISTPTNLTLGTCTCSTGTCTASVQSTTNFFGSASFKFRVTANGLQSNEATANVTVNNVNDAPTATGVSTPNAINEDSATNVTLGYTDVDQELATACALSDGTNLQLGSCSCNGSGVCTATLTSTSNYNGSASFKYTVTVGIDTTAATTSNITVNAVDDAPVTTIGSTPTTFNEDVATVITLAYSDIENDLATSCSVSTLNNVQESTACSCTVLGVCTVGITGTLNYNGAASFTYTVTANSLPSDSRTVNLTLNAVDDAPVGANFSPSAFNEDTEAPAITLQYSDVENDVATSCAISSLTNVTETTACSCTSGVCTVKVTGTSNYYGAASFNFTVTANGKTSIAKTATLSITNVDDPPVSQNITGVTAAEDATSIQTNLVYSDIESDLAATCSATAGDANVTVGSCSCTLAGVCTVTYTTALNFNGSTSVLYRVTANGAQSNESTISITISAVDDAPVADAPTLPSPFNEDTTYEITLPYTDVEAHTAASCATSDLSNVSVTTACACASGTCTVSIRGTSNFFGSASFKFTVTANSLTSATRSVPITIINVNDVPIATTITYNGNIDEDVAELVTLLYTDADSELATACSLSSLVNVTAGSCSCNGSGVCSVTITSTSNYFGSASFDYNVTTGTDTSANVTASFTIQAVDDAPVVTGVTPASISEDVATEITLEYSDVESHQANTCAIVSAGTTQLTYGTCLCTSGVCKVTVTGSPLDYNGAATLQFNVSQLSGLTSASGSANITITAVEDAPRATAGANAAQDEDAGTFTFNLPYFDPENDLATSCSVSNPSNFASVGVCTCSSGTCSVQVSTALNFNGTSSLDFNVTANGLTSNTVTRTIPITPVDDAPVTTASSSSVNEDTPTSALTLSYSDVESHLATTCTTSNLINVTVTTACSCTLAGVCTVAVQGTLNYFGSASFDFTVTANGLTSNVSTHSLTINAVDDPPVVTSYTATAFNEDTESPSIEIQYTDVENNAATTCSTPSYNAVTITTSCTCTTGTCTIKVLGSQDYNGTTGYVDAHVVANGLQSTSTGRVSLSITAVNDFPTANNLTGANKVSMTEDVAYTLYFSNPFPTTATFADVDNDSPTGCTTSNVDSNLQITSACSCASNVCSVGIQGIANYFGTATFNYRVTTGTGNDQSNLATVDVDIAAVDDAPAVTTMTPDTIDEDVATELTLGYSDVESNSATECEVNLETNSKLTLSTSCTCTAGTCKATVVGNPTHYNGTASIRYRIKTSAGGAATPLWSSLTSVPLTIAAVNDIPVKETKVILEAGASTATVLPTTMLKYVDPDDTTTRNSIFVIKSTPTLGTIRKSGVDLTVGNTFTQNDIDQGLVFYNHTAVTMGTDTFTYAVRDSANAYATDATDASPATFEVYVDPGIVNCDNYESEVSFKAVGNGTTAPYVICNASQLDNFTETGCGGGVTIDCGKNIRIERDINMSSFPNFLSIGTYTGTFDGNEKKVTGLNIIKTTDYAGLFTKIEAGGSVSELMVEGSVSGRSYVGLLTGYNNGTISKVAARSGSVTNTGGSGTMYNVGGLVGRNVGTITDSYAKVSVTGSSATVGVGGLVGYDDGETITDSYASGTVSGGRTNSGVQDTTGGLVGTGSGNSTFSCNFWDTTVSGLNNGWGSSLSGVTGITGKTNQQMKTPATFNCSSGHFNTSSTWVVYAYTATPRFQYEGTLLNCTAGNGGNLYDKNGDSIYDTCYYPNHANCELKSGETRRGTLVDSGLDGVSDGCLYIAANNQTCNDRCSNNTGHTSFSASISLDATRTSAMCNFLIRNFMQDGSIDETEYSASPFDEPNYLMADAGCMVVEDPTATKFSYQFNIVRSPATTTPTGLAPLSTNNYIDVYGGYIRRACGCATNP